MAYRSLADLVVVFHVAFILFVAVGALLAWRWPRLVWLHLPAAAYATGIVTISFTCPLTPLEKHLRRIAGQEEYSGGFVKHYLDGVVYPGGYTPLLRTLATIAIVVGYVGLAVRWRWAHAARTNLSSRGTEAGAP
jgi:hypothetical protein